MRLDHIVIHVDRDPQALSALGETVNAQGYPFEPRSGRRGPTLRSSRINIGDEYLEIVQLLQPGMKTWVPQWVTSYDAGWRGAFCLFLEVEDVERVATDLKKSGIAAQGPALLKYPVLGGLLRRAAPYVFYLLPRFSASNLQVALMQYNRPADRVAALNGLIPNAQRSGVQGIRRVEIALPDLPGSLPLLQKVFEDLEERGDGCEAQADKARVVFTQAEGADASLRLVTVASQRSMLGRQFRVENVEVFTGGG